MPLTPQQAAVLDHFKRRPVATMEQLRSAAGTSHMTVFRVLKQRGYFTSFNHNARYYALRDTPRFDANGLWFYRSIGFSRHGGLAKTLIALVQASPAGCTPADLALLLRTQVANLLPSLASQQLLARRRLGRHVVYLAALPQRQELQWAHRQQGRVYPAAAWPLPSTPGPAMILPLLVELIRSPEDSTDRLSGSLARQGVRLSPAQVQAILDFYQLEKKEVR